MLAKYLRFFSATTVVLGVGVLTEVLELVLAGADVSILAGTALLSLVSVVFTVSKARHLY